MDIKGMLAFFFFLTVIGVFAGIAWVIVRDYRNRDQEGGGNAKPDDKKDDV